MRSNFRALFGPIGILAGGIIGAGVFSLPYVIHQAGLLVGLGLLAVATIAYSFIHLMYADVLAGSSKQRRFVGYIAHYLGPRWSYLAILIAVVEMICVLTIYLILSISFSRFLFPTLGDLPALAMFWAVSSTTIYLKLRRLAFWETAVLVGILAIMISLFILAGGQLETIRMEPLVGTRNILLPLAVIFFSLSGRVALPPLVNYFRSYGSLPRRQLQRAVVIGTVLPALSYVLFIIAVLVLSGSVSQDAVTGMLSALPVWLTVGVGCLGLLTLWSSYILVGLDVRDTLNYDLDLPAWLQIFLVVVAPILLYLLGFTSFVELVGFVGGIFLAFEGVFIVLLWRAAHAQGHVYGLISGSRAKLLFLWAVFTAALIGAVASRYH